MDISNMDFRKVGITWRVKKGLGVIQSFHSLGQLQQFMNDNEVDTQDTLSYDNRTWIPLHSVENLPGFFTEIWKRAERGEVKVADDPEPEIDDDFDAPTKVVRNHEDLLSKLREADAMGKTPTPSPVYRTRGAKRGPKYLEGESEEANQKVEEVVRVHDPMHIAPDPVVVEKKPTPAPEPSSSLDQRLMMVFILVVVGTVIFAALLVLDIEVPFLTEKRQIYPQNRPVITTPTEVPTVPNHEINVPTDPVDLTETTSVETD